MLAPSLARLTRLVMDQAPGLVPIFTSIGCKRDRGSQLVGTFAGADFQGGAVRQGTAAFRDLVGAVDVPSFVGGLIQNAFQAIVTA